MANSKLTDIGTARGKTGPRTPEGRTRALAARLRGKLPHSAMVVPGVETLEEWEQFRAGLVAQYQPVGLLETELADRIAHQLWRLRRFSRYEADRAAWRMKVAEIEYHRVRAELMTGSRNLPSPLPSKPDDSPGLILLHRHSILTLWYLDPENAAAPDETEHDNDIVSFISALAVASGLPNYKVPDEFIGTVGDVRRQLGKIAKRVGTTEVKVLEALLAAVAKEWDERDAKPSARQNIYDTALHEFKRTQVLPTDAEVKNASRWESHLERSLCRMMDRLERLQRMRAGELIPAPALVRVETDRD